MTSIGGKRVTSSTHHGGGFVVIGTSHMSGFTHFFATYGWDTFAIHGGNCDLVRELILTNDNIVEPRGLWIAVGGNDLTRPNASAGSVLGGLSTIIRAIHARWRNCIVITGSIIPRFGPTDEKTIKFLDNVTQIDGQIIKHHDLHHHYVTDLPVGNNMRPRRELFGPDGVHLSQGGTMGYEQLFDFVLGGINFDIFRGSMTLGPDSYEGRLVFWKF